MKTRITLLLCFLVNFSIFGQENTISFQSTDTALQNAFTWAKKQALFYKGDSNDPVGPWYESSLPGRSAFCMRDISHQCIGAEIIGLSKENCNVFSKFTGNISESKQWCSYWEINKWDKPAPVDYSSDKDFWYNLDANFDVIYACWRLYNWTGNKMYISDPAFVNFYEKSLNEYITKWKLEPDSLLNRPQNLNVDPSLTKRKFRHGYGLASYAEGVPGLVMSTDLIAAIYRAYLSYHDILNALGKTEEGKAYAQKAEKYSQELNSKWWDPSANLFNTYYVANGTFGKGEGEAFLLWFDVLSDNNKIKATIDHLNSKTWNVENTSYLPYLLYTNGYWDKAYSYMLFCSNPTTKRREYPEVSYGVIEGIVQGLMGVCPDAVNNTVSTIFRTIGKSTAELNNLSVLGTSLNIKHEGITRSVMQNNGTRQIKWRAMFSGNYKNARIDKKTVSLKKEKDRQGKEISFVDVDLKPNQKVEITVF